MIFTPSKFLRLFLVIVHVLTIFCPTYSFAMQTTDKIKIDVKSTDEGIDLKILKISDEITSELFNSVVLPSTVTSFKLPLLKGSFKGTEGFSGNLGEGENFFCDWKGNFSLIGDGEKSETPLIYHILLSSGDLTLYNVHLKELMSSAKKHILEGIINIDKAELTTPLEDKSKAIYHIKNDAEVAVETLIIKDGEILNEGTLESVSLEFARTTLKNTQDGVLKGFGDTGVKFSDWNVGMKFINAGDMRTSGRFNGHFLTTTGYWHHTGDVYLHPNKDWTLEPPMRPYTLEGKVVLENGCFTNGEPVLLINKGKLILKSYGNNEKAAFTLINQGQLTFLEGLKSSISLKNEEHKKIKFEDGLFTLSALQNYGVIEFDGKEDQWTFGQSDKESLIFATGSPSDQANFQGTNFKKSYLNSGSFVIKGTTAYIAYFQEALIAIKNGKSDQFSKKEIIDQETFNKTMLVDNYLNLGSIKIKGSLDYSIANTPGKIGVSKNLKFPTLAGYGRSLSVLEKVECLEGETDIQLNKDEIITQQMDLSAIKDLTVCTTGSFKVLSQLTVQQLFLQTFWGFNLGQNNDERGSIRAVRGYLYIQNYYNAFNAKYGEMFSEGDMALLSEKSDITIGDYVLKSYDREKWLGITQSPSGHEATTKIFDLNGTKLHTNKSLRIHSEEKNILLQGAKMYSAIDTVLTAKEKVTITRSELEGTGTCILGAPSVTIETKGKSPGVYIWGKPCDNDCGHQYAFYGYPFLSDRSILNFVENIIFNSKDITLSGASLFAGEDILGSELKNTKAVPLMESCSANYHECKHHKRFRQYWYNHSYKKEIPNIILSGKKIEIQGGNFTGSFNMNTQKLNFTLGSSYFFNPNSHTQKDTPQLNLEIDLTKVMKNQIERGNSMMRLTGNKIEPIFRLSGFNAPMFGSIPQVGFFGKEGFVFNPMENVPLDLLLQGVLGKFARKLHMGGLSGSKLIQKIFSDSQKEKQDLITEEMIKDSKNALLYYKPEEVGTTPETKLMFHLPEEEINTKQETGDISFKEGKIETDSDQTFVSTRLIGEDDVNLISGGKLTQTRKVHTDINGTSIIQTANAVQQVISKKGSVHEKGKDILLQGSDTFAKKFIIREGDEIKNENLILTNRSYSEWKRKGKWHSTTTVNQRNITGSSIAGEGIIQTANLNTFLGSHYQAGLGGMTIKGDVQGNAVFDSSTSTTHTKSKGLFSSRSSFSYDNVMTGVRKNIFLSSGPIEFNNGTVDLEGTDFFTPLLIDNSSSFTLGGSIFTEEHSYSKKRSNLLGGSWMAKEKGHELFFPSRIFGNFVSNKSLSPEARNLLTLSGVQLKGDSAKLYKNLCEEAPTIRQWFRIKGGKYGFSSTVLDNGDPLVSSLNSINTGDTRFDQILSSLSAVNEGMRLGLDSKNVFEARNSFQTTEALKTFASRWTSFSWSTQTYSVTQDRTYQVPVIMDVKDFVLENDASHLVGLHTFKTAHIKTDKLTSVPFYDVNTSKSTSSGRSVTYNVLTNSPSFSANQSNTNSESQIFTNSKLKVDHLIAHIGEADLLGMNIRARILDMEVERTLNLSSVLSSRIFDHQSWSGSFSSTLSPGNFRFSEIDRVDRFVNQPSGIVGREQFHLRVGGTLFEGSSFSGVKTPFEEHSSDGYGINAPIGTISAFVSTLGEVEEAFVNNEENQVEIEISSDRHCEEVEPTWQSKEIIGQSISGLPRHYASRNDSQKQLQPPRNQNRDSHHTSFPILKNETIPIFDLKKTSNHTFLDLITTVGGKGAHKFVHRFMHAHPKIGGLLVNVIPVLHHYHNEKEKDSKRVLLNTSILSGIEIGADSFAYRLNPLVGAGLFVSKVSHILYEGLPREKIKFDYQNQEKELGKIPKGKGFEKVCAALILNAQQEEIDIYSGLRGISLPWEAIVKISDKIVTEVNDGLDVIEKFKIDKNARICELPNLGL